MLYSLSFMISLFLQGGWVFKPEKNSGLSAQTVKYLGISINLVSMTFEIPVDKFKFILKEATFLIKLNFSLIRRLPHGLENSNP